MDRIASAWLIRRFIDPKARFKFVGSKTYQPKSGEVRFDMFEAEYTHEGDRCTLSPAPAGRLGPALRDRGDRSRLDCKMRIRTERLRAAAVVRGMCGSQPG